MIGRAEMEAALPRAWEVLEWYTPTERSPSQRILYAVVGDGYAVASKAFWSDDLGWCAFGDPLILFADTVAELSGLIERGPLDGSDRGDDTD